MAVVLRKWQRISGPSVGVRRGGGPCFSSFTVVLPNNSLWCEITYMRLDRSQEITFPIELGHFKIPNPLDFKDQRLLKS